MPMSFPEQQPLDDVPIFPEARTRENDKLATGQLSRAYLDFSLDQIKFFFNSLYIVDDIIVVTCHVPKF